MPTTGISATGSIWIAFIRFSLSLTKILYLYLSILVKVILNVPGYFVDFFSNYFGVRCILAHCRPVLETIALFHRHPNVYGDTAFLPHEKVLEIITAGFKTRLLPGSDFPITHYFAINFPQAKALFAGI